MRVPAAAVLSCLLVVPCLRAQDAAALAEREQKLVAKAVAGLHTIADALQAQKQHLRALELRKVLLLEYAENDEKARDKCGFTKAGNGWRRDDTKLVLDTNLKADAGALKKIDQNLAALNKELLAEHKALAAEWTKANDAAKGLRHWKHVARLAPGDADAAQALALQPFEGFHGTPAEITMLRRARTIRGACDWLRRADFVVKAVEGEQEPLLAAAKVAHKGVRSEHFTIWGTLPPSELTLIAQDCERALQLCYTLMGTSRGTLFVPDRVRNMVFLADKAHYGAVLDQCADAFDPARLQFLKNDVDLAFVNSKSGPLRLHKAYLGIEASRDQAARGVVQDAIGVMTDGLIEGIGHTACGLLFGRSLTFLLEQQKDRTATAGTSKTLTPDIATWFKLAEESAWGRSDTRTCELVLLSAAKFTSEQRVKAWAMCNHLMLTHPEWLLELDASQSKDNRTGPGVEAEFQRRTKADLAKLDEEWRDFWARATELRKAIAADPLGEEKAPDRAARVRARSLVDALDAQRAAAISGPAGFFVATGADVAAVQKFDEQLLKAEAERKRKPKEEIALPTAPPVLGRTVLLSRQKDAAAAVVEWLRCPAQRDALLHPGRGLFGAGLYSGAWLLDCASPAMPTKTGGPQAWPRQGQTGVPASALVSELGPRAAAALAAAGKQPTDTIGMPLSLHFFRQVPPLQLNGIEARAYAGNMLVPGVVVSYGLAAANGDAEVVDGCVALVPLEPLPAGASIEVQWELPPGMLAKNAKFAPVTFTVK